MRIIQATCFMWLPYLCFAFETNNQQCTGPVPSELFLKISEIANTETLNTVQEVLLKRCQFGLTHSVPDRNTCFNHCDVRRRTSTKCFAVLIGQEGKGCQMCTTVGTASSILDSADIEELKRDMYVHREYINAVCA